jgi:hypothetical protein
LSFGEKPKSDLPPDAPVQRELERNPRHELQIADDPEVAVLAKRTDLGEVLADLKENLPGAEPKG